MSLLTDIRNVSDSAIEQLSARFGDLPKPLLAAIGAGDLAAERLAHLREQVRERIGTPEARPSAEDAKTFASEFPGKAQKRAQQIAGDLAHQFEQFASEVPGRAQQLISELPAKAQEFSNSLSAENLKSTIESYTEMVGHIYGNLAERGGETVAKARTERSAHAAPAASGGDGAARKPRATRPAARRPGAKNPGPKPTAVKRDAVKRTVKTGARTTAAGRTPTPKVDGPKVDAPKVDAPKVDAPKAEIPKDAVE